MRPVCCKLQSLLLYVKLLGLEARCCFQPWLDHSSPLNQILKQLQDSPQKVMSIYHLQELPRTAWLLVSVRNHKLKRSLDLTKDDQTQSQMGSTNRYSTLNKTNKNSHTHSMCMSNCASEQNFQNQIVLKSVGVNSPGHALNAYIRSRDAKVFGLVTLLGSQFGKFAQGVTKICNRVRCTYLW